MVEPDPSAGFRSKASQIPTQGPLHETIPKSLPAKEFASFVCFLEEMP